MLSVGMQGGRKAPEAAHVCAQLASALCTLAELRLTSADGLEDIGAECEALLQEVCQSSVCLLASGVQLGRAKHHCCVGGGITVAAPAALLGMLFGLGQ